MVASARTDPHKIDFIASLLSSHPVAALLFDVSKNEYWSALKLRDGEKLSHPLPE
jgi:hypothetical protein